MDGLDSLDKYPDSFHVELNMELKTNQSPLSTEEPWNYHNDFEMLLSQQNQPLLFSSPEEMNQLIHIFGNYFIFQGSNTSLEINLKKLLFNGVRVSFR